MTDAVRQEDELAPLLHATARGDRRAARELFGALMPVFARVGGSTLGPNDPELDDFIQEAALRFFRGLGSFRGDSRVRWFAFRIASHTAADWVRGKAALKRSRVRGEIPEHARGDDDPARTLRRRQLWRRLAEVLPEPHHETFLLRSTLECSIEDIAGLTGVPANTVRSRLRRAKQLLREHLERDPELLALLEVSP